MKLEKQLEQIIQHIQNEPPEFDRKELRKKETELVEQAIELGKNDIHTLGKLVWKKNLQIGWGYGVPEEAEAIMSNPLEYFPFMRGQTRRLERFNTVAPKIIKLMEQRDQISQEWADKYNEHLKRVQYPWYHKFRDLQKKLPEFIKEFLAYIDDSDFRGDTETTLKVCQLLLEEGKVLG